MRRRTLDPAALDPHLGRLLRSAAALTGDWDLAEDLVQATCLHVVRDPQRVRQDDVLRHCLATMRELFADERRGRRRRVVSGGDDGEPELVARIARLPAEQRDAVVAVDIAGLDHEDAADLLGVRAGELGTRLYRGRDRLARDLDEGQLAAGGGAPLA